MKFKVEEKYKFTKGICMLDYGKFFMCELPQARVNSTVPLKPIPLLSHICAFHNEFVQGTNSIAFLTV